MGKWTRKTKQVSSERTIVTKKKATKKQTQEPKPTKSALEHSRKRLIPPTRKEEPEEVVETSQAVKDYPSPSRNPIFRARWNEFVDDVTKRDNFKLGHLSQLRILCDLYVEYEDLTEDIRDNGYTYESIGRNGIQVKQSPTVVLLLRNRAMILNYSKALGLVLVKDKELNPGGRGKAKDPDTDWS